MLTDIRKLYAYRELLWMWTLREIKVRYKQSILGGAWAILQPLSLTIIFTVVFSFFVRIPSDDAPYPIFAYTALLPWTFFAASIGLAVPTLVNNMNLVTKIYFPREILPLATVNACLVDFLIALLVWVGMALYYHVPLHWTLLWAPLVLVVQVLLTFGLCLGASAMIANYRDVRFVVPLVLQLWLYATPVIYPMSMVPERFRTIYMLNPMSVIVNSYRRIALEGTAPEWSNLLLGTLVALGIFVLGYYYFKRVEVTLADVI